MTNLARKDELEGEIGPFMARISGITDLKLLHDMCHEFLYRFPPQRGLEIAAALTYANPFFMADIPAENAKLLSVNLDLFAEIIMRAKLTVTRSTQTNIIVACAPKSASTFIQDALQQALSLPIGTLFTASNNPSGLGANLREQEPDELALLRAGLNGRGYVSQHHARCSPYVARLLTFYRVRPIVTHRNILDTLVSMDDMLLDWRSAGGANPAYYFNDGLPTNYTSFDREDRLMMLAQRHTAWLIQFYVSWKKCERLGLVQPLWISYEDDFLGDKMVLAKRVSDFLGPDVANPLKIAAAFEDKSNGKAKRLNKGIAGRGKDIPQSVQDQVMSIARYYRDEEDITQLVGE